MAKTFYEVVLEGHYNFVYGMLEGYKLAAGKNFIYYLSQQVNVKATTLSEVLKEFLTLKSKLQYVIIEANSWKKFEAAVKKQPEHSIINKKYIKSIKKIESASFEFNFECYAKKYGDEIKGIFKSLPKSVKLIDYAPKEEIHKEAKGTELYAPDHEYSFKGKGKLVGDIETIITFNKKFDEHPLIDVSAISLNLK
ncbi:MAG TPA: hypothetical protein PL059_06830 [Spirochaetota bacterium]|nr:hypothetical protein [Spirochaetota bacterium]HOM08824.1 hypothetical protein [Spirochaetota bacterium]HPP49382.1 hypothetical protein [Spirochaetota bacterium]